MWWKIIKRILRRLCFYQRKQCENRENRQISSDSSTQIKSSCSLTIQIKSINFELIVQQGQRIEESRIKINNPESAGASKQIYLKDVKDMRKNGTKLLLKINGEIAPWCFSFPGNDDYMVNKWLALLWEKKYQIVQRSLEKVNSQNFKMALQKKQSGQELQKKMRELQEDKNNREKPKILKKIKQLAQRLKAAKTVNTSTIRRIQSKNSNSLSEEGSGQNEQKKKKLMFPRTESINFSDSINFEPQRNQFSLYNEIDAILEEYISSTDGQQSEHNRSKQVIYQQGNNDRSIMNNPFNKDSSQKEKLDMKKEELQVLERKSDNNQASPPRNKSLYSLLQQNYSNQTNSVEIQLLDSNSSDMKNSARAGNPTKKQKKQSNRRPISYHPGIYP